MIRFCVKKVQICRVVFRYGILFSLLSTLLGVPNLLAETNATSDFHFHNAQKELILKTLGELRSKSISHDSAPSGNGKKEEQKNELSEKITKLTERATAENEKLKLILQRSKDEANKIKKFQQEVKNFSFSEPKDFFRKYDHLSLEKLEEELNQKQSALSEVLKDISLVSQKINEEQILPEKNQKKLNQNQQMIIEERKKINNIDSDHTTSSKYTHLYASANILFLENQNEVLTAEIQESSAHLEFLSLEQQILSNRLKELESSVFYIQNRLNYKRKEDRKRLAKNTETEKRVPLQTLFLQNIAEKNNQLSQDLLSITDTTNSMTNALQMVRTRYNTLSIIRRDIDQQSSLLGKSVLLARKLRETLMNMPSNIKHYDLSELLTNNRLDKLEYDQQKQQLNNIELYINTITPKNSSLSSEERYNATILLNSQSRILENLSADTGKLTTILLNLQVEQQRLKTLGNDLSRTLKQQLFWVTSSQPLTISFVFDFTQVFWNEITRIPWKQIMTNTLYIFENYWPVIIITFLLSLWIYVKKNKLLEWQMRIASCIGKIKQDSLLLSPLSLFLSLIYILPSLLFFTAIGSLILIHFSPPLKIIGYGVLASTGTWGVISFFRHIVRPMGLAHCHFQWKELHCFKIDKHLKKISRLLVPMTFLTIIAENQSSVLDKDILGQTLLMVGAILQARFIFTLLRSINNLFDSNFVHTLMLILLPGLSFLQAVLVILGYYYTALILEYQILGTLALISFFILLREIAIRCLGIGEIRLAYQRALKKYTATDNKPFEEPTLDLATVNKQSLRLLNTALIISFVILFYWVWKNFADVLSIFKTWALFSYEQQDIIYSVYFSNFLFAFATLASTFILTRNLPGLLEITILSRLKLPPGNSYAITTLLNYTITSFGIIITLSSIGVGWEKLQWLIAAVGLGVSISLKEIFANVLSGLIILFERPIRIGDTISLGDQIGEVSRIHIRATTIIDWDHKEVIIPNNVLLNEKLVNWSLSNSILRLILPFYVHHNSDPQLVEKLLYQACSEVENVVKMPRSIVTMKEFGDSALLYEVRVFISHVNYRLSVRNDVNKRVTDLFEKNNIIVAPQKHMVYLHQQST